MQPMEPSTCWFWQGLLEHRVLVLIDPALGPAAQAKKFGEKIIPPYPVDHAGVYDYPSFELIQLLEGWSHLERPNIANPDMRFILRDVFDPPVSGKFQSAVRGKDPSQWPPGLALYDEGKLVRYFPSEDIFLKYMDLHCFPDSPGTALWATGGLLV